MPSKPDQELAALVAAWHNRHPLAQRITPAQVQGMGVVVLPFLAGEGAGPAAEPAAPPVLVVELEAEGLSLRERVVARLKADQAAQATQAPPSAEADITADAPSAPLQPVRRRLPDVLAAGWQMLRRPALKAAFSEDFIAPLSPRRAARFARRHGSSVRPGRADWPERLLIVDAPGAPKVVSRYLRTAAIELGERRVRVLVGTGARAVVLGPRLWSRPRMGALAGVLVMGVALGALWPVLQGMRASGPAVLAQAEAPAVTPTPPAAPSAPASAVETLHAVVAPEVVASMAAGQDAPQVPQAPVVPDAPAERPAQAVAVAASAAPPASAASVAAAAPEPAPAKLGDIRPRLTDEQREAARQAVAPFRTAAAPVVAVAPAAVATAAGTGQTYALITRTTKGRAASEVMLSLMVSAAAGSGVPHQPRPEVMQVDKGWRAVWWPFRSTAEVEQARAVLAQYGINAEVVEF